MQELQCSSLFEANNFDRQKNVFKTDKISAARESNPELPLETKRIFNSSQANDSRGNKKNITEESILKDLAAKKQESLWFTTPKKNLPKESTNKIIGFENHQHEFNPLIKSLGFGFLGLMLAFTIFKKAFSGEN